MLKCCVIFYHKNIDSIYRDEWIKQCVDSIKAQTFQNFDTLELNYGDGGKFYAKDCGQNHLMFEKKLPNHTFAMNFLITEAFERFNYDVVFNINMDDYYSPLRFVKQIQKIQAGYQLVSSNFWYVNHNGERFKRMNMTASGDIGKNLLKRHNVICHPVIAIHKSFWDLDLRYNDLLGFEDLDLWQRAFKKGKKFYIIDDYLCNYRLHGNQVTKTYKAK